MRHKQSCSINERISKETVLAMLQAPSVQGIQKGERVEYTDSQGKSSQHRVLKVNRDTVTLIGSDGTFDVDKSTVKKNDTPLFLDKLAYDQWTITSFDPKTRIVCISISTPGGNRNITVTLPIIEIGQR